MTADGPETIEKSAAGRLHSGDENVEHEAMQPKIPLALDETQTGWTSVRVDGALMPTYLFTTNRRIVLVRVPISKVGFALFFLSFLIGVVLFANGAIFAAIVFGLGGTATGLALIIRAPYRSPLRIDQAYPIEQVRSCEAGAGLLDAQSVTITFDDGTRWRLRDASRGVQSALLPLMLRNAGFDVTKTK